MLINLKKFTWTWKQRSAHRDSDLFQKLPVICLGAFAEYLVISQRTAVVIETKYSVTTSQVSLGLRHTLFTLRLC